MNPKTAARINAAIDAAMRASLRLGETTAMLAWIFLVVLLTQFASYGLARWFPGFGG